MARGIFDNLDTPRAQVPSAQPVWEVDEKLREAARRIEGQRCLIASMALTGKPTTEASFDLNRMYLLHALLLQMRQRMNKLSDPTTPEAQHSRGNRLIAPTSPLAS